MRDHAPFIADQSEPASHGWPKEDVSCLRQCAGMTPDLAADHGGDDG
jgi:hypothetical protein